MKQLFVLFSAVMVFASCNNSGGAAADLKDSADSVKNEKLESIDDAARAAKDTIEKNHDSLNKRIDALADQASDSLNKNKQ